MEKLEMLKALVNHYADGNKKKFAEMVGLTPQAISNWFNRKTFDVKACLLLEDVSKDWLLTGEGDMVEKVPAHVEGGLRRAEGDGGIPLVPISALAGTPGFDADGVLIRDCVRYYVPEFEERGAEFLIRVSGDSMEPTYRSQDIVACRKIDELNFFQWGKVYVIDSSQGQLVKKIMPVKDNRELVLCVSENDKYPPFELPVSDIRSVSLIVGLVRME